MALLERPRPAAATAQPAVAAPARPVAPEAAAMPAAPATSTRDAPAVIAAPAATATPATTAAAPAPTQRAASTLTPQERREASMFAEVYSILVTTQHLEEAFVRGVVSNEDYERNCKQLIAQFKTLQNGLKDKCPDVRSFAKENGLNCPLAEERLLGSGVTATTLFGGGQTREESQSAKACFKASEGLITLMDALKLNMTAVDELMPLVRDLQASIVAIPNLPKLDGIERISGWLVTLNGMRASDSLDENQCRQLSLDVEQAYNALKTWLGG